MGFYSFWEDKRDKNNIIFNQGEKKYKFINNKNFFETFIDNTVYSQDKNWNSTKDSSKENSNSSKKIEQDHEDRANAK